MSLAGSHRRKAMRPGRGVLRRSPQFYTIPKVSTEPLNLEDLKGRTESFSFPTQNSDPTGDVEDMLSSQLIRYIRRY
jgi:hypothetical protein